MKGLVIPVVWLRPPGWPPPVDLPPLADLAPSEAGTARLAALREPVAAGDAARAAERLGRLEGVERAGWLEPARVVALGPAGPVTVLERSAGGWAPARGQAWARPSDGALAVLTAARLRLGLARRTG